MDTGGGTEQRVAARHAKKNARSDDGSSARAEVRQRAISRIESPSAVDNDDWRVEPGQDIAGWLYDILVSVGWEISPLDIMETERHYPGLMDKLAIESWVTRLLREQMERPSKETAVDGD